MSLLESHPKVVIKSTDSGARPCGSEAYLCHLAG